MRTNLQTASNQQEVVQYFVKAMKHYINKEMLVVPFNMGNPINLYQIRPGLVL
jgi:hypothetical protein